MVLIKQEKKAPEVDNILLENKTEKVKGKTTDEVPGDDNEGVPTDSGFAWVIVLDVFTIMTLIIGFNRSLSVLFVDISEEFHEKATTVSLMFTLHSLSSSVSSIIVSNIIMSRMTVRNICLIASVFYTLISVLLSLAPNIILFLLLFVLKGTFFGALLVSPMSLIGFYFKKRRSLASSIATAGMCVAFIVFPPVVEALRVQFGMRGSFLILSAIELHLVACSLLLRPVESYTTIYKIRQQKKQLEEERIRQLSPIYIGPKNGLKDVKETADDDDKLKESERLLKEINGKDNLSEKNDEVQRKRSRSDAGYCRIKYDDSASLNVRYTPSSSPTGFTSLIDLEVSLSKSREDVERSQQARKRSLIFERQTSHLSAISMTELPYIVPEVVDEENEEGGEEERTKKTKQTFYLRLLKTIINVSLFKFWRFRMMAVFTPLSVFANYTIIYMPVICSTSNISKSDAAFLMTLSGVMDLITRVVTGFIGDFKFMSKPKLVSFSMFVVGTVCHCIRFFTNYTMFVVYAVLVGVFGGVRQNFFNVMLMDYVGVQNMAKAYGLTSTLATLALSINHPVVAAMFDVTKGFVIPLHYVGAMVYLATIVILSEPIFRKLDEKNNIIVKKNGKSAANVPER